jgi:polyphosphate kinase
VSSIDQTEESPRNLMSLREFNKKKHGLQVELLKWQHHAKDHGEKHMVIFEGRDGAGKGGTIKRFMEHMNPKSARVVALDKPTETERRQWYWQRYVKELPKSGEITFWDRSWYNRATVEKVMGFASEQEIQGFFNDCPAVEMLWKDAGIRLIKFWLDVSKKEQARRFKERESNPLKLGKLSPIDRVSQDKWKEYTEAEQDIFLCTDNWVIVKSDCKRSARIACMQYVLIKCDYTGKNLDNIGIIDPTILEEQRHGN